MCGNICLNAPREASFPCSTEIFRRDQGYRYILGCNVAENIDNHWNVDGERELSDTWTGFTRFTVLDEKPPGWIHMVGGETDKKTNDLQTRRFVARDLERYVRCIETQREAEVGYRETKARRRQEIAWYFLY